MSSQARETFAFPGAHDDGFRNGSSLAHGDDEAREANGPAGPVGSAAGRDPKPNYAAAFLSEGFGRG